MRTPPPTVHLFDTHPKPVPPAFPPEGLSVFGCLHISRNLIFQAAPAVARVATSYPRCPLTAPVKARRASARSDASCGATWHPRPRRAISTWRPREDLAGVGLQTRVPGRALEAALADAPLMVKGGMGPNHGPVGARGIIGGPAGRDLGRLPLEARPCDISACLFQRGNALSTAGRASASWATFR